MILPALLAAQNPAAAGGFSAFYLFATAQAAGIACLLPLVPIRQIGRKFFILMSLIAVVFYVLAVGAGGIGIPYFHMAAAGLLILFNVFVPAQGGPLWMGLLILALACGMAGLVSDAWRYPAAIPVQSGQALWLSAISIASSLLLGAALVSMVLGHWYLVARKLSFDVLLRVVQALLAAIALRVAVVALAGFFQAELWSSMWEKAGGASGFFLSTGIFVGARALFGIVLPAWLAWMAWQCVKIRSNQSATGILYVLVAFVLIGEIIARHLLAASGLLI